MTKRVFVSGCYDMLHSGHIAFFKAAATYGDLYVGIGSDRTIEQLKGRKTINSERERLYMVKAVRYVKDACINSGSGMIDFLESLERFKPDYFVVNEDGHTDEKEVLCRERGIEYVVLQRIPDQDLPPHSTTAIRENTKCMIPFGLDIAGTWIDQPFVSQYHPGWAINCSLEPTIEFEERCGMKTSTRNSIKAIWPYRLPDMNPESLAKIAFCLENKPSDQRYVSGAQDAICICMPGLLRHYYEGSFWPTKIETILDEDILSWVENHICLIKMFPRKPNTDVYKGKDVTYDKVVALTKTADGAWDAIKRKDLKEFAYWYLKSHEAQIAMFPSMMNDEIAQFIEKYRSSALAWKITGAGGGGYLALVCEKPIEGSIPIKIRRKELL